MNKPFSYATFLLLLVILCNCKNDRNEVQNFSAFEEETDWEIKNLRGKVKSISVYKATYIDPDGVNIREPILTSREQFTKFGSSKITEYYDNFGNLSQVTTNEFDESEFLIKSLTDDKLRSSTTLMTIEHDSINNIVIRNVVLNDSLIFKNIEEYDENEHLIREINIEKGDTVIWDAKQEFDQNNRLVFQKVSPSNNEKPQIFSFKYDNAGNVIESINGNDHMKFKSVCEYDGNTLIQQTDYVITADNQEHLKEITIFDQYANPISLKIYEESELNRELKNKYVLDEKGNWIKKNVSFKEHYANSKSFTPAYIETREIEYWQ